MVAVNLQCTRFERDRGEDKDACLEHMGGRFGLLTSKNQSGKSTIRLFSCIFGHFHER